MSYRTSPYTPFLRRFTDERAQDIAETINLYSRVTSAHRASMWARSDAIERVSNFIVERVADVVELPDYVPLGQVFDTYQRQLLALETAIFSSPDIDFSKALTLREQVDLNRFLRSQEYFLEHQDRISEQLVMAIGNALAGIIEALPPLADSAFTVPLISLFPEPGRVVDSIIGTLYTVELADVGLFATVGEQIYANMCEFSGVPKHGSSQKPLIAASDADIAPDELVETYLTGTPFHALLLAPVPFSLPDEQRFSGQWVIAPPGRGKTTLLHAMFLDDLRREASIIVLDSKGDLIEPIKNLRAVADRLVLIEPDPEFPLALNPLDIPRASIAHTISLLEYVMSSLLEAKMTALQTALFRKLLPAFVEAFPNPTLETFRRVLIDGMAPYGEQLANLSRDAREFFTDARHGFNSKTYTDTRNQLVWRLDFLLSNPILKAMFASIKTKLDIGKEMDAGKIIIINNSKALLGDEGAEFFGRFFIALILAAAQQRAGRRPEQKRPVYCYIDECHTVIARDPKIATILDECRSQRIALILSHQRSAQLTPGVLDAVVNCGIRFANSDDEAKFLADKLRTTADFLYGLPRGTFAAFVRDLTPTALALKIPYTDMDKLPRTTAAERQTIRERMRAQFSFTPQSQAGEQSAASRTEPAERSTTNQRAAPAPRPAPPPVPLSSPHTGDHTEPAAKWGDS